MANQESFYGTNNVPIIEPEKKSNKGWIFAVIIILVLLAGGGFCFYYYGSNKDNSSPPGNEPLINENDVNENEQKQNCGSVNNTHVFVSPADLTTQEKTSLSCINNALVNCTPAAIEFSGQGGGSYEIQKKDNQDCIISQKISVSDNLKTCRIPLDFIATSKLTAEEMNQTDKLFALTIPFVFSFGKVTNVKTGEIITFDCR